MDLHDELENAIGHGPTLPTPQERLAAGQAALRRRRALVSVGAAAAVAAVVLPLAVLAGGGATSGTAPSPAAPPSVAAPAPSPSAATEEPTEPAPQRWQRWESIRYSAEGQLEIRPGVEVLDRVDGYLSASPRWEHSVAMEVRRDGTVHWVSAEWDSETGSSSGSTEANDGWVDFRAWVASQTAVNVPGKPDPGNGYPDLVFVEEDGSLAGHPGTTVLEQRQDLGFPENFAPAGAPTAAAVVERDGVRYLVLYRLIDGASDLIPVPAAGHGETLDALLAWARGRYESGEGVR